jgi:hypothetical protein
VCMQEVVDYNQKTLKKVLKILEAKKT